MAGAVAAAPQRADDGATPAPRALAATTTPSPVIQLACPQLDVPPLAHHPLVPKLVLLVALVVVVLLLPDPTPPAEPEAHAQPPRLEPGPMWASAAAAPVCLAQRSLAYRHVRGDARRRLPRPGEPPRVVFLAYPGHVCHLAPVHVPLPPSRDAPCVLLVLRARDLPLSEPSGERALARASVAVPFVSVRPSVSRAPDQSAGRLRRPSARAAVRALPSAGEPDLGLPATLLAGGDVTPP
mmetsp:Transcript_9164/g.15693  ORF Transcript_9164/g.15693 Transcript_9164/m.15693 type:complete len:239 (+) Transcript_9164:863-1579(+)